jgi:hypothetical protein
MVFMRGHFVERVQWNMQENRTHINKSVYGKNVHYQLQFEDFRKRPREDVNKWNIKLRIIVGEVIGSKIPRLSPLVLLTIIA